MGYNPHSLMPIGMRATQGPNSTVKKVREQ
jgi:hypothetical protein